jgi:hypothetical protein
LESNWSPHLFSFKDAIIGFQSMVRLAAAYETSAEVSIVFCIARDSHFDVLILSQSSYGIMVSYDGNDTIGASKEPVRLHNIMAMNFVWNQNMDYASGAKKQMGRLIGRLISFHLKMQ